MNMITLKIPEFHTSACKNMQYHPKGTICKILIGTKGRGESSHPFNCKCLTNSPRKLPNKEAAIVMRKIRPLATYYEESLGYKEV